MARPVEIMLARWPQLYPESIGDWQEEMGYDEQGADHAARVAGLTRIHRRDEVTARGVDGPCAIPGRWGRCLSSVAAGRPCDRLRTLGRVRWWGEDAARDPRGPGGRELAGTFGWPDGGRLPPPPSGREWQGS